MMTETQKFVRRYDKCQRFAPISHHPAEPLHSITSWPFARWDLDIIGELLRSQGGKQYILMATEYFTKWIEAVIFNNREDGNHQICIEEHLVSIWYTPRVIADYSS